MAGSASASANESKRSRPFFSPLAGGGGWRGSCCDLPLAAPGMIGSRLLSLVRSCRPRPLGRLRQRRVHDRRPKHFLLAHEDSELAIERLTDRHAASALHELGGLTRQLQGAG